MSDKERRLRNVDDLDEDWEEEYEEENSPLKSFIIFITLAAIAGIICTLVWVISHQNREDKIPVKPESNVNQTVSDTLAAPEVKPAEESTESGETSEAEEALGIEFSMCNDTVTPKEYVNLRIEPSTEGGQSTVYCQVNVGDKIKRTGYNLDYGWSRVEYDGQVLYVVTSYVEKVEE